MISFTEKNFLKYYIGDKTIYSHIDAVHAAPLNSDLYTGEIVKEVVENINCSGIISTVSRKIADLNRSKSKENEEAIVEYRHTIREILNHLGIIKTKWNLTKPYLHLAIHGMTDKLDKDIEVGTRYGETCDSGVKEWFIESLRSKTDAKIVVDSEYYGDISKRVHRLGDSHDYIGYGVNFNTFQIEISKTLRKYHRRKLVAALSEIILEFNSIK